MPHYTAIVTLLAVLFYFFVATRVTAARGRFNVQLPATAGNPDFELVFRVQMNTLEQLVVFVPSILLFAHYFSPYVAAGLGAIFILGRLLYFVTYVKDPKKWGENRAAWQRLAVDGMAGDVGKRVNDVATSSGGTGLAGPVVRSRVDAELAKSPQPGEEELVKAVGKQNNANETGYGDNIWKTYQRLYPAPKP